ncbi:MAG: hypothetical protein QXV69_08320 [Sulfolobaceae archaeon]
MTPSIIQQDEDPDVEILQIGDYIEVYVDLRGRDLKLDRIDIKIDKNKIYLYDVKSNNIIKIIKIRSDIILSPNILHKEYHYGTLLLRLKKIN